MIKEDQTGGFEFINKSHGYFRPQSGISESLASNVQLVAQDKWRNKVQIKLGLAVFISAVVFSAVPAHGQQKGQYIPGQQGLNAGVLPDPGFTYANLTLNYSADTLKNANGNSVPLTGSY